MTKFPQACATSQDGQVGQWRKSPASTHVGHCGNCTATATLRLRGHYQPHTRGTVADVIPGIQIFQTPGNDQVDVTPPQALFMD